MTKPAVKPLLSIAGILPASMGTAHSNMRGPRDTTPANEPAAEPPKGLTVHKLLGDDDDHKRIPDAPVVHFTPRISPTATPIRPKENHMADPKSRPIIFGNQARSVVEALAAHGALDTAGLVTRIKQPKGYIWNGCYQARKLKYITKVGKNFEVTAAGRMRIGATETTGSGGTGKPEKPGKKAPAKKPRAVKTPKPAKPARGKKARGLSRILMKTESVSGTTKLPNGEISLDLLRTHQPLKLGETFGDRQFIPCGPGSLSRAVKKFDGGMLVIDGNTIAHELTAAQVALVVDAEASAVSA